MDEYFAYFELFWSYFPYIFYTFVLLTFLPKSLGKIKKFADADYEANRHKFHRCYGPELCCHNLIEHDDVPKSTKPRKAVTRGYLRKQQSQQQQRHNSVESTTTPSTIPIKRQVQVSAIQTNTNVNKIAKMFESGNKVMGHKKINRVLPEIRTTMHHNHRNGSIDINNDDDETTKSATNAQITRLLNENIENSMNLLHQQTSNSINIINNNNNINNINVDVDDDENWQPSSVLLQRRTRNVPKTLGYSGTSATPSTASPAASSPHSSPSPPNSPILRTAATATTTTASLNLKTSVEDIFAAIARNAEKNEEHFIYSGCNTLSPVTSIDDILSQRRLSRPLSAYSISDLLGEDINSNKVINTDSGQQQQHQQQQQDHNNIKDETFFVENLLMSTLNA